MICCFCSLSSLCVLTFSRCIRCCLIIICICNNEILNSHKSDALIHCNLAVSIDKNCKIARSILLYQLILDCKAFLILQSHSLCVHDSLNKQILFYLGLGILLALGFEIIHGNALRLYEVFKLHISLLRVCFCLFLKCLHSLFYVFLRIFHDLRIGVNSIPSSAAQTAVSLVLCFLLQLCANRSLIFINCLVIGIRRNPVIGQFRWSLKALHGNLEYCILSSQFTVAVALREGYRYVFSLTLLHSHDSFFKSGNHCAASDHKVIIITSSTFKSFPVFCTYEINSSGITILDDSVLICHFR